MSFTNINDPAGVSALLEKLRSSQAWHDLQTGSNAEPSGRSTANTVVVGSSDSRMAESSQIASTSYQSSPEARSRVASLLSQLRPSDPHPASSSFQLGQDGCAPGVLPSAAPLPDHFDTPPEQPPSTARTRTQDPRTFSFQQSLPHLARLSEDPSFVKSLAKMRREQEALEKDLWKERQAIHKSQEAKVKVALTKANMLGTGITEREASAMAQSFLKELHNFDKERVLPTWEGFITKQQTALEALGVPTMFPTRAASDRERQKKIIHVLEGITEPAED